jgi:hypothetical protein
VSCLAQILRELRRIDTCASGADAPAQNQAVQCGSAFNAAHVPEKRARGLPRSPALPRAP